MTEDLDSLVRINGLTLEHIERRARAITDNLTDPHEFRYRSFDGFLGGNESLMEVIASDSETLRVLGVTTQQIVELLRAAVDAVDATVEDRFCECRIVLETAGLVSNGTRHRVALRATKSFFMSPQYSLFYNDDNGTAASTSTSTSTSSSSAIDSRWRWCNDSWNTDYEFFNDELQLSIKLAGNGSSGIVRFIEHLGFFEGGGSRNSYRLDPCMVLAVLQGVVTSPLLDVVRQQYDTRIAVEVTERMPPDVPEQNLQPLVALRGRLERQRDATLEHLDRVRLQQQQQYHR